MATPQDTSSDSPHKPKADDAEKDLETVGQREPLKDSPGSDGGTSGTGGTNHRGDRDITS